MHLVFKYMGVGYRGEYRHAQIVMKELGITYQCTTPQTISDSFWFWNCENVPNELPDYIYKLDVDPMDCIGWGLSEEKAIAIRDYKRQ